MSTEEEEPRPFSQGSEDAEQARFLAACFEHGIRYDHTARRWHAWNGVRWAPDKTADVQRRVHEFAWAALHATVDQWVNGELGNEEKTKREKIYRRLLEEARAKSALDVLATFTDYKTDGADWDQNPYLLGCENGIVDLRLNALVPAPQPNETLVTLSTGHNFIPFSPEKGDEAERRAPRFMRFLDEVTSGDAELALFYLFWFGYNLFGLTDEHRFMLLIGHGRNGKGALAHAMITVFGEYSAASDEGIYMKRKQGSARSSEGRPDLLTLKGKRLAIMSEPEGGEFNEELLKKHTGGDQIKARALYSNNMLTWMPTHHITFLCNKSPTVEDIGPSWEDRLMVADFRERYEGQGRDKRLYEKLDKEADGILAILCWAARLWYDSFESPDQTQQGLKVPQRIIEASAGYLESNDPIGAALTEAFVQENDAQSSGRDLYETYIGWFRDSGRLGEPMNNNDFSAKMVGKGFRRVKVVSGIVYRGIRPKTDLERAGVKLT